MKIFFILFLMVFFVMGFVSSGSNNHDLHGKILFDSENHHQKYELRWTGIDSIFVVEKVKK
jgi:hypothetical protein